MSVYENGEHKPYESESKSLWNIRYVDTDDFHGVAVIFIKQEGLYYPMPYPNEDVVYWQANKTCIDLAREPMTVVWEKTSSNDKELLDKYLKQAEDDLRKDSGLIFTSAWNDFDYQKKDN